jgi:hypothetical protein
MLSALSINFNRPEKTRLSIKSLMEAGITNIHLFQDGPPKGIKGQKTRGWEEVDEILRETQKTIAAQRGHCVLLQEGHNLGTAAGPRRAMQWFFSEVPAGLVVEDDILIHPSTTEVHGSLLRDYHHNSEIYCIGSGHPFPPQTYHDQIPALLKTKMVKLHGWSSWSHKILPLLQQDPPIKWRGTDKGFLKGLHPKTQVFLYKEYLRLEANPNWAWDYPLIKQLLTLQKTKQQGFSITPTTHLHENIGNDGSGHNCRLVFGETETWSQKDVEEFLEKFRREHAHDTLATEHLNVINTAANSDSNSNSTPSNLTVSPTLEKRMERERYGRINQMIGRQLLKWLPYPIFKKIDQYVAKRRATH